MDAWKNQLFFGDNLKILRDNRIPVDSVDLIYLDPPFNSNATYNILFAEKSGSRKNLILNCRTRTDWTRQISCHLPKTQHLNR